MLPVNTNCNITSWWLSKLGGCFPCPNVKLAEISPVFLARSIDMGHADSGTDQLTDAGQLLWPGTRFHRLESHSRIVWGGTMITDRRRPSGNSRTLFNPIVTWRKTLTSAHYKDLIFKPPTSWPSITYSRFANNYHVLVRLLCCIRDSPVDFKDRSTTGTTTRTSEDAHSENG